MTHSNGYERAVLETLTANGNNTDRSTISKKLARSFSFKRSRKSKTVGMVNDMSVHTIAMEKSDGPIGLTLTSVEGVEGVIVKRTWGQSIGKVNIGDVIIRVNGMTVGKDHSDAVNLINAHQTVVLTLKGDTIRLKTCNPLGLILENSGFGYGVRCASVKGLYNGDKLGLKEGSIIVSINDNLVFDHKEASNITKSDKCKGEFFIVCFR